MSTMPGSGWAAAGEESVRAYVGTYTGGRSKGIYQLELNTRTGAIGSLGLAVEITQPSFLAVHPNGRFLYSVNEQGQFGGKTSGAVSAFSIDPDTGRLTLLNQAASGGGGPCHLTVDRRGRHVLAANYGGGSVAVLPIGEDGRLRDAAVVVQHEGSSVHPKRQTGPHAHGIYLDPANRHALVPDLGLDKVFVYRYDAGNGSLLAHDPPWAALKPGAGPRHLSFHPHGRWVYVINELDCTISAFGYEAQRGALEPMPTVSTLPDGESVQAQYSTAEVAVHPSGAFLYGSNRGHDSIAMFSIDRGSGRLTLIGHAATQGKTPRNFGIDPTGRFLLAANQNSDAIVVFRIDPDSGALTATGHSMVVPSPVCVVFMQP